MNKVFHSLKKHWITAWLVVAAVGTVSFFTFAEYIEDSNRAKRVIANTAGAGDMFSSDLLMVGGDSGHEVSFGDSDDDPAVTCYELPVKIWNYDSSNPTFFYDAKDITYTLTAQLMKMNSSGGYDVLTSATALTDPDGNPETNDEISIKIKTEEGTDNYTEFSATPESEREVTVEANYIYTVTPTYDPTNGYQVVYTGLKLFKSGRDENKILIQFPKSMRKSADKIYVKLTATPTPSLADYSGLHNLSRILSITEGKTELSTGWSASFNDDKTKTDYDGFNYVISGNGSATITFKWRDDKFEINPFFLSNNTTTVSQNSPVTENNVTWNSITISANSDIISRYDIQLYMKNENENINTYAWNGDNDVNKYVQCIIN